MTPRALLFAVVLLIPAMVAPASAAAPNGAPEITFDQVAQDLGVISDTRGYRTSFRFTNTGNAPLVIEQLKSGCPCLALAISKTSFAPGESGVIEAAMDPTGRTSSAGKAFMVFTNAAERPQRLMIKYRLRPLLKLTYGPIDLGVMKLGAVHRHRVEATYIDPHLRITSVDVSHPDIEARVLGQGAGGPTEDGIYSVAIELEIGADASWGSFHGVELIVNAHGRPVDGDEAIDYTYRKPVSGNVYGHVHATSLTYRGRMTPRAIVDVGPVSPGQGFQQSVQLQHDERVRFFLTNARPEPLPDVPAIPGLAARTQPAGPGGHQVHVSGQAPQAIGPFMGSMLIDTDLPDESPLRILVVGEVVEGEIPTHDSDFRNLRPRR